MQKKQQHLKPTTDSYIAHGVISSCVTGALDKCSCLTSIERHEVGAFEKEAVVG